MLFLLSLRSSRPSLLALPHLFPRPRALGIGYWAGRGCDERAGRSGATIEAISKGVPSEARGIYVSAMR